MGSSCPGAPGEEEALQEGPVALLGHCKPSLWWPSPPPQALPPSSEAENELGRWQSEYFEKKKLKSKMKLLEVSSPKRSAVSLDLLNLYVVNQISTKKDNTETFAYHHGQQINLKENVQNYSRKKSDDESVKEASWRQNQLFGFEEFTTAQEKESKFGASSNLHEMERSVESPLSSQSYSYSPRQTESSLSCSPDTCEEEDTAKKEYLNEQSLKTHDANLSASREAPKSFHTRTVPLQPSRSLTREEENIVQEKGSIFCATEEENKNLTTPSEGSSSHRALKREYVTRSSRCDVWSQTERSVTEVEKADVATQCGTLRVCSCGGFLPAARSPAGVPPPRTAGTAGEDELPAQELPQPGIAALPSEAEYLCLAGKRTLEVLNYIDKMKERDKQ
ncbi:hypothetical protein BTVI_139696 [Pitangus sulphuratus]|nr:hypothetical protein BTVI_139696 [Pitangus sulphuratus]